MYDSYYHFKQTHDSNEVKEHLEYENVIKRKRDKFDIDIIEELF